MNRMHTTRRHSNALRKTVGVLTALLIPAPLFAHEGHGFAGTVESLLHWLSSPYHVILLAAAAVAAVAVPLTLRHLFDRGTNDVERWG